MGITGTPDYGSRVYTGWRHGQVLPWLDFSSEAMPSQHRSVLDFCHFLWVQNSDVREGLRRIIAYFRTDIDVTSADQQAQISTVEKEKWRTYLLETLKIQEQFEQADIDLCCYGNYFLIPIVPFERFLSCPQCGVQFSLESMMTAPVFRFQWDQSALQAIATCPKCKTGRGYRGAWRFHDHPVNLEDRLSYKFIPPQEMEQLYCNWTRRSQWRWRIPSSYINKVRRGEFFHLKTVPQVILECIRRNTSLQFHEEMILHGAEPLPSGLPLNGWGISRMLLGFRDMWNLQVIRRANEAQLLDYLIPTRLISPAIRQGSGAQGSMMMDSLMSANQGEIAGMIRKIFRDRQSDPLSAYYLPFPVETRLIGGEANQLVTVQLLENAQQQALNATGLPVDFYRGSLQNNAVLPGLKLMESQWQRLPLGHDGILYWWVNLICRLLEWQPILAKVVPVAHAIGIQEQVLKSQLAMNNLISGTELLRGMGQRWPDQQRTMMDEAKFTSRLQENLAAEQQDREMGKQFIGQLGYPAAGGQPPEGGGNGQPTPGMMLPQTNPNAPRSPQDIIADAEGYVQQLMYEQPAQKNVVLRQLREQDPLVHQQVLKGLEDARKQMRNEGGAMLARQQGSSLL